MKFLITSILTVSTLLVPQVLVFADTTTTAATTPGLRIEALNVELKNDFVLEPGKAEIFVNPGETITKDVYITNRIPGTTSFKMEVQDIKGSSDPTQPVVILDNERGPYSAKDFITASPGEFTLSFGQRVTIPVTITIPKDTAPGDYDSSVLVSNSPSVLGTTSSATTEGQTRIISRVGTLFFIRVNGQAHESGELQDFKIAGPHKLFYTQGPFTFEALFNNTGNVHLVPYGTVNVKNIFGKTIAQIPVDAYYSLPNSLRYRSVNWDVSVLLGRYTATLDLHRGYGNIVDSRTIAFWVIPWKILISIFAGVLVLALILIIFFRSFEFRRK
jgi:hypothetical protein